MEKLGHTFIEYMKQFTYIHRKKRRKNNCPNHKNTCQCLHKLYTFIQDFTCLHTLHCEKKCDKMYFWRYFWDDVSVVLSWKNLKLWYDKPDYIIEQVIVCTKGLFNSEWIYEVIFSSKIPTKNYKDFCPGRLLEGRAKLSVVFGWDFGPHKFILNLTDL